MFRSIRQRFLHRSKISKHPCFAQSLRAPSSTSRIGTSHDSLRIHPMSESITTFSTSTLFPSPSTTTTTTVKSWPVPMIESNGDYRNETYLEKYIGGPLYSTQEALPRLPIPEVSQTIEKFLPTALPLVNSPEETSSLKEQSQSFELQSAKLQQLLKARKEQDFNNSSWLQKWWNQLGYLQVRDPVVVNVSYFFHMSDDPTLHSSPSVVANLDDFRNPLMGVKRGASILVAVAEFRRKVISGTLPVETIGRPPKQTPLCSVAFKYMFNASRIPHRIQDSYRIYDPSRHRHAIVARKGQFYSVDFVDEDGMPLPLELLERRLSRVVRLADEQSGGGGETIKCPELGWLTSTDRDSWADAREGLLQVGGVEMEKALTNLESGAFMLCLDDEEPVSRRQCSTLFWHGGLSSSGRNRWFDKSIQIFSTDNGKAGLLGEHSMMDGMPMVGLADHIVNSTYRQVARRATSSGRSWTEDDVNVGVNNIFAHVAPLLHTSKDRIVTRYVTNAKKSLKKLTEEHDLHVQSFQGYGSDHIKRMGYSPDAYVQMAIQLATYRLFMEQAATYEATQTRVFMHGRTETTRSVSPASAAFVQRMGLRQSAVDGDVDDDAVLIKAEKVALLRKAVESHVTYMREAAKGLGVDRHFLGLSLFCENPDDKPDLLSHPIFVKSKTWRVSTSHLTHPKFENWGFGEVVPNGVGVGYAVKKSCCVFNLTARKEHNWTEKLCHLLEEALLEMRDLHNVSERETKKQTASKL